MEYRDTRAIICVSLFLAGVIMACVLSWYGAIFMALTLWRWL